jgi:hypothetical protein
MIYNREPNTRALGMLPIMVGPATTDTRARLMAASVKATGAPIVLEWEAAAWDGTPEQVQAEMAIVLNRIKEMRKANPNVKVGLYGVLPRKAVFQVLDPSRGAEKEAWKVRNDMLAPLAAAVDFIVPDLYMHISLNQAGWLQYATENVNEAKRYGKPVIPILWPRVHNDGTAAPQPYIPGDQWRFMLDSVKAMNVSGIIIWDTGGFNTTSPVGVLDETQGWWIETKNFLASQQ